MISLKNVWEVKQIYLADCPFYIYTIENYVAIKRIRYLYLLILNNTLDKLEIATTIINSPGKISFGYYLIGNMLAIGFLPAQNGWTEFPILQRRKL